MMDSLEAFNRKLFLQINAAPETLELILSASKFIANGLILYIPLLLAFLWLWGDDRQRFMALKAVVAFIIALGVSFLIGHLWYHPRPLALNLGHTYFFHRLDASFPSDHTIAFAVVGFALLGGETVLWGRVTLAAGLLVGWARVFLGVHFPADILGAFVVSYLVCLVVSPVWSKVGNTLTKKLVGMYRVILAPMIKRSWVRR